MAQGAHLCLDLGRKNARCHGVRREAAGAARTYNSTGPNRRSPAPLMAMMTAMTAMTAMTVMTAIGCGGRILAAAGENAPACSGHPG